MTSLRKKLSHFTPLLNRMIDLLSLMIANVSIVLSPELIIFKGHVERYADLFLPSMIARMWVSMSAAENEQ